MVNNLQPVSPHPMQQSEGTRLDAYEQSDLSPPTNVDWHTKLEAGIHSTQIFDEGKKTCYGSATEKSGPNDDHQPSHIGVPDGGWRAWLVVFGAFLNFTLAFGLLNSFGTFQAIYEGDWPGRPTSIITWIGSVQLFVLFLGGVVVGPAFDKWGARPLMLSGTFCCLVSFIGASFSEQFYQFLLSQGILFGIGNALLFYPSTSTISEWFNKKRALALGIAVSGSSIGGVIWPMVLTKLFDAVNGPWTHRLVALISVPFLLVSCSLVKERKGVAGHNTAGHENKVPQSSHIKAILQWRFGFLCLSLLFIYCGMLVPFHYIPVYAEDCGISTEMANNLLAIGYVGSFFGRIGSGWAADCIGRFTVLFAISLGTSIVTFSWIWIRSLPGLMLFVGFFGLFSGGLVPLGSACVAQTTPDMGHIGLRIGAMMAFCSVGALAGGPISGAIRDHFHDWAGVFGFSSSLTLIGAFLLLGVRIVWQPQMTIKF